MRLFQVGANRQCAHSLPGPLRFFSFILFGGFSRYSFSFVGRPHNTTRGVARMSFSSLPQLPSPTPSCSTHQRKKPSQRSSCSGDEVNHHLGRKLFSPPPPPDQKKTKTHSRPVLTAKKSACICRRRKLLCLWRARRARAPDPSCTAPLCLRSPRRARVRLLCFSFPPSPPFALFFFRLGADIFSPCGKKSNSRRGMTDWRVLSSPLLFCRVSWTPSTP